MIDEEAYRILRYGFCEPERLPSEPIPQVYPWVTNPVKAEFYNWCLLHGYEEFVPPEYMKKESKAIAKLLKKKPSVTPQEPRCKNCRWRKGTADEYRRRFKSICHINNLVVYNRDGYCRMFEPQAESEVME